LPKLNLYAARVDRQNLQAVLSQAVAVWKPEMIQQQIGRTVTASSGDCESLEPHSEEEFNAMING